MTLDQILHWNRSTLMNRNEGNFNRDPMMSDVVGFMHDIRSPLSVIKGFIDSITDTEGKEGEFKLAAKHSIDRVLRLVESLGAFSPSAASFPRQFDIARSLRFLVEETKKCARERGINILYVGPPRLSCCLRPDIVDRAIANLIINAIEAGKDGGWVRVELSSGYGALQIEVADNGCGIDDARVVKIFERGFTHGKARGTGVGLHVCKKIVEASGGVIDVISRKGKGTTFTVSIPLEVVLPARP